MLKINIRKPFRIFIFSTLIILFVLVGCNNENSNDLEINNSDTIENNLPKIKGYIPSLSIIGDIENPMLIDKDNINELSWSTTEKNDITLPCFLLEDLINNAKPFNKTNTILLVGSDGLVSEVDGDNLSEFYIAFGDEYSWECLNETHPISSKIKMLKEIVVVSDKETILKSADSSIEFLESNSYITIIDANEKETQITFGQMYKEEKLLAYKFEGKSKINENPVTVYTPKYKFSLKNHINFGEEYLIVSRYGSTKIESYDETQYLELNKNTINHINFDGTIENNIVGIFLSPPENYISNVYDETIKNLDNDNMVMIIQLDGLGLNTFNKAKEEGYAPFLSSFNVIETFTNYPPISPVSLGTMLTGVTPDIHGIQDRDTKDILSDDMFSYANKLGKKSSYIEGDSSLIKTSLFPKLSPDLGEIEGTDDEVFTTSMNEMKKNPDLLFIHFHGIDDIEHNTGPYSQETMEKVKQIDGYVSELIANWNGQVIITSDHGLHEENYKGNHGIFTRDDLIVPYILTTGGK